MNSIMSSDNLHDRAIELVSRLQADQRSANQISREAGVSQPTVSRLRASTGARVRMSLSFNKLCIFYGIRVDMEGAGGHGYNELLRTAVIDAWDGTEPHGRALLHVLKALKLLHGSARNVTGD